MSQTLGTLEFQLTANSTQLKRELQMSQQLATVAAQAMAKEIAKSLDIAASQVQGKRSTMTSAIASAMSGDFSPIGRKIGDGVASGIHAGIKGSGSLMRNALEGTLKAASSGLQNIFLGIFQGIGQSIYGALVNPVMNAIRGLTDMSSYLNFTGAQSGVEALGADVKQLTVDAKQASKELGYMKSQTELIRASYDVISSGFSSKDAMTIVKASTKASVAAKDKTGATANLDVVGDATTTILNSYKMGAEDAEKVTAQMVGTVNAGKISLQQYASLIGKTASVASSAGVSLEDLNAVWAASTVAGVRAESSIDGLRAALAAIAKPSQDASEYAQEIGLDFSISAVKSKGFLNVLRDIMAAGADNPEGITRLFGSVEAWTALQPVFDRLKTGISDIQTTITGVDLNALFEKGQGSAQQLVGTLKVMQEELDLKLKTALAPIFESGTKALTALIQKLVNTDDLFSGLQAQANRFSEYLEQNPGLIDQAYQIVKQLIDQGISVLVDLSQQLFNYLQQNPNALKDAATQAGTFMTTIKDLIVASKPLADIFIAIVDLITKSVQGLNYMRLALGAIMSGQGISGAMSAVRDQWDKDNPSQGTQSSGKKSVGERILEAIKGQESGGDHRAVNEDSGALGLYQIMPENLPKWSKEATGRVVGRDEFLSNPQLQTQIAAHHLEQMYNDALYTANGNESEAVRRVASEWYSGDQSLLNNKRRQGGGKYPSIYDYTMQVLNRYNAIPASGSGATASPSAGNTGNYTLWSVGGGSSVITSYDQARPHHTYQQTKLGEARDFVLVDKKTDRDDVPVPSAVSGQVTHSGKLGGYGNAVIVKDSQGRETLMGHFASTSVKEGDSVVRGQTLGIQGSTGRSEGVHVHIEAPKDVIKEYFNEVGKTGGIAMGRAVAAKPETQEEALRRLGISGNGAVTVSDGSVTPAAPKPKPATETALEAARKLITPAEKERREQSEKMTALNDQTNLEAMRTGLADAPDSNSRSIAERSIAQVEVQQRYATQINALQQDLEDLQSARSKKVASGKKDGIDYSAAIKDVETLIAATRRLQDQELKTANTSNASEDKASDLAQQRAQRDTQTEASQKRQILLLQQQAALEKNPIKKQDIEGELETIQIQFDSQNAIQKIQDQLEDLLKSREYLVKVKADPAAISRLDTQIESVNTQMSSLAEDGATKLQILSARLQTDREKLNAEIQQNTTSFKSMLTGSNVSVMKAQATLMSQNYDTFGANELQKQAAIMEEQNRYRTELLSIEKQIAEYRSKGVEISNEEVQTLKNNASAINKINLKTIDSQFKTLGTTIADTAKSSLGTFLTDLLTGTASVKDAFKSLIASILNQLAQLAVNSLFKSLFGGGTTTTSSSSSGGGIGSAVGGLIGKILGFSDGGDVPAMGGNAFRSGYGAISDALRREGTGSVLAALTPGEKVLNLREAAMYRKAFPDGIGKVYNFSEGGDVGFASQVSAIAGSSSSTTITVPVTVGSDSKADPVAISESVKALINDWALRQQRPGGLLWNG